MFVVFVRLSAHSLATIANFKRFSKLLSSLNGMVECNHWDQWFSNGFGVRQPLVTMVFDGCFPLVRRWNGYVPSSKSTFGFPISGRCTTSALLLHYFCTTSALLLHYFCTTSAHHSSPAFALFHFCTFQFLHFFSKVYFSKVYLSKVY